ncbi:unnamed protein product [Sphenostylis stenocarpa]|uniref:Uncharacterized protein n=1 Tax=Sphenostylis stenocarpa TaxID=92480 RepID=A0AA86VUD2_9FABA|nr:unnamed protein product [Sphenostylis stenocarpa]
MHAKPWYKLEINVYDKNDDANFIFWDRECSELIGMSALELRELMREIFKNFCIFSASQADQPKSNENQVFQQDNIRIYDKVRQKGLFLDSSNEWEDSDENISSIMSEVILESMHVKKREIVCQENNSDLDLSCS